MYNLMGKFLLVFQLHCLKTCQKDLGKVTLTFASIEETYFLLIINLYITWEINFIQA